MFFKIPATRLKVINPALYVLYVTCYLLSGSTHPPRAKQKIAENLNGKAAGNGSAVPKPLVCSNDQ
jgi:hypothetical protein